MTIKIKISKKGCFEEVGLGGVFCLPAKVVPNPYFSSIMQRLCDRIWKCYMKEELCRFLYVWIFSGSHCWHWLLLQYLLQVGKIVRLHTTNFGVAQTVFLSPAKRGRFDENGENDEFTFYPLKTGVSLLGPPKTTKMTKMAGVTQEKAWFRKNLVCSSLKIGRPASSGPRDHCLVGYSRLKAGALVIECQGPCY